MKQTKFWLRQGSTRGIHVETQHFTYWAFLLYLVSLLTYWLILKVIHKQNQWLVCQKMQLSLWGRGVKIWFSIDILCHQYFIFGGDKCYRTHGDNGERNHNEVHRLHRLHGPPRVLLGGDNVLNRRVTVIRVSVINKVGFEGFLRKLLRRIG